MRKILAALAIVGALIIGLPSYAAAASNGNHDQGFTCTTSGGSGGSPTQVHAVFSYHVTGVGADAVNVVWADQITIDTSPGADMDSVYIFMKDQAAESSPQWELINIGAGTAQNDVHEGTYIFTSQHRNFTNGTPGYLKFETTGGTGNYNGNCQVQHAVL